MTREEYLERGGILLVIRAIPALLSCMGFGPNTYQIFYRKGKVFDGEREIRYHTVLDVKFVTGTLIKIQCDCFAEKRYLDFARGNLIVMFQKGFPQWYICNDTTYRGVAIRRKS